MKGVRIDVSASEARHADVFVMEERRWQIELPFTRPLSLNHRMHYTVRAKATAEILDAAREAITLAGMPALEHCRTWIECSPRDRRVRDSVDPIPTLTTYEDAMKECGAVGGDNPPEVQSVIFREADC